MVLTSATATVYGKALVAGDEFDCPEKEAKVWSALRRAKSKDGSLERRARRPRAGQYGRRDMRAES
jgi:hypothetical protein